MRNRSEIIITICILLYIYGCTCKTNTITMDEAQSEIINYVIIRSINNSGFIQQYAEDYDDSKCKGVLSGKVFIIYSKIDGVVNGQYWNTEYPIMVWCYVDGILIKYSNMKETIREFNDDYDPAELKNTVQANKYILFGIYTISKDAITASIYIGESFGIDKGLGRKIIVKRNEMGKWKEIEDKMEILWVS